MMTGVTTLGDAPTTTTHAAGAAVAPATRATRPGWRDPRLWIGVALVVVSVVAGARLLAAADDSVPVWVAAADLAAGDQLSAADLEPRRVRFADAGDLDRYLAADQPLPTEARLLRGVGAGELVPASAIGSADDSDLLHLPLAVDLAPAGVAAGSVVDIYVRDTGRCGECEQAALQDVTVLGAPTTDDLSGVRQLVVAVEPTDAEAWFALLAGLEQPVVTVVGS